MMPPEPLRSTTAAANVEDTSLALPNDNKLRSGQQRVLDQVHTIKRSKSKQGRNGTLSPSPTATVPHNLSSFTEFGTFKFTPAKANGYYSRGGSTFQSANAQKSRALSLKAAAGRHFSSSATSTTWEQQFNQASRLQGMNGLKSSRSDPALAPPFAVAPAPVMRAKGQTMQNQSMYQSAQKANRHSSYSVTDGNNQLTNSQTRVVQAPSTFSPTEGKMGTIKISKVEQKSAVNTSAGVSDMTLEEAVEYLSNPDEKYQQCGATFIQHSTYSDDKAKPKVSQLGGIPVLVSLLRSPNPSVSQAAAGALRNLVFHDQSNKLEVQHCGGIAKALQLLKETDSTETQKQITGLLWNLSSTDKLKEELIRTALPALTENVVVPFTCWSEGAANNHVDPQVFFCATGCLRNLSSGEVSERQAMRNCPKLVDSLMTYVQSCVAEENPDDKSVENCACILHNLTYQLEKECPLSFSDVNPLSAMAPGDAKNSTVGCFSPKSGKAQKELSYDMARMMPKIQAPSGVKWLCHPKAMETYLALLNSSKNDATVEACCGALQNLTAGDGLGSSAVSQILVQKYKAPLQMASLLNSKKAPQLNAAVSLLSNISRTNGLQKSISKQIMPELSSLLVNAPESTSDDTMAMVCKTAHKLIMADPEIGKKVIGHDLIYALNALSEKGGTKSSKAAGTLLFNLWGDKNAQSVIKKLGIEKSVFVNEATTMAHRALQVID
ncbi:unnamed protein product [Ophioblennius macclurei]